MGTTFAEKFEEALEDRRQREPGFGVRTLARELATDELTGIADPKKIETIRRRLNKYRPKPGGGAAEVAPTEPTRREIERHMRLDLDALKPDEDLVAALNVLTDEDIFLEALRPFAQLVASKSNAPAAHLVASTTGASTNGG